LPDPVLVHPAYATPDRDALRFVAADCAVEDPADPRSELASAFALLAKLSHDFSLSMDLAALLERALGLIAAGLDAEAGSLWLAESEGREIACHACVGPHPITGLRLPTGEGIVGRSVRDNLGQSVLDVAKDPDHLQLLDAQSGFVTRSILCAPLSLADRAFGAIQLINRRGGDGRFDESDAHRLQVLAASAALAIANARTAESLVERERARRELELAAGIQRALLPSPRPEPFPVCGVSIASRAQVADFYDIVPLADGRVAFCIGDVAGGGIHAALLMAKTASLFRCLAKSIASPARLLAAIDAEICANAARGCCVRLGLGRYDPERGEVTLVNAGLEPALLHRCDGGFDSLAAGAAPLGRAPGPQPAELRCALAGGTLYLCTDGLLEAACVDSRERLGSEGLTRLILRFAAKPPSARIAAIAADVARVELRDDLTLLAVSDAQRRSE
jgi:sigma-B regulation protein RsbU (phosphoserine phosphatase)